jgi:hypothetical protein
MGGIKAGKPGVGKASRPACAAETTGILGNLCLTSSYPVIEVWSLILGSHLEASVA